MTKQVQRRRGTATQHTSFTGAEGELSVNTTNKSVHVHDNVTAGGFEAARADMDNVTSSSILTAAGITATTAELNYVDGVTSNIQTQLDGKAGTASPTFTGTLTTANLTATGTTTLAGASTSADITFGDNDKAIFGAGSDLQIYHDGGNSVIHDDGTGDLQIQANNLRLTNQSTTRTYAEFINAGSTSLYHDNALKFNTTSTGIYVTGTVTADGLTVADGTSGQINIHSTGYNIQGGTNYGDMRFNAPRFRFFEDGTTLRMNIDNGDISFYEDTGTTPKFFWDASEERLGIGTSSPSRAFHIQTADNIIGLLESTDADAWLAFKDNSSTSDNAVRVGATGDNLRFYAGSAERMRIDSSGNVGINGAAATASGYSKYLHVQATSTGSSLHLTDGTSGHGAGNGFELLSYNGTAYILQRENNPLLLYTNDTERMRIDSSGNLLVGKTSLGISNAGHTLAADGYTEFTRAATSTSTGGALNVGRNNYDGTLATFWKDGSTVGSIGANSGYMYLGSGDTGLYFNSQTNQVYPVSATGGGANEDGTQDLGRTTARFKDLYLSSGVYLGGTTSSNKLDDYEEGTWTPVVRGNSSAGSATYATQTGTYTKVGRTVTFEFAVVWSGHTGTGSIEIGGFPFNAGTQTYYLVQTENISLTSGSISFTSRIDASDNYGLLIQTPTGGGVRAAVPMDAAGDIRGVGTYQTA